MNLNSRARSSPLRAQFRAATTNALLEAAEDVAADDGVEAASLTAIAARAGVAVGTVYNYFADRDALMRSLFAQRRAELVAAVDSAVATSEGKPFAAQIAAFVGGVLAFFDERRAFLRIVVDAEHVRPPSRNRKKPALVHVQERAARLVARGVRGGALRREHADLHAEILVGMVRAVCVARAHDPRPLVTRADAIVTLFFEGAARR